jgi:hypothetical protein
MDESPWYLILAGWSSAQLLRGTTERDRTAHTAKLNATFKMFLERVRGSPFYKHLKNMTKDSNMASFELICERQREGDYYRSKEMMVNEFLYMLNELRLQFSGNYAQLDVIEGLEKLMNECLVKDSSSSNSSVTAE